jgi:hypothetical protein
VFVVVQFLLAFWRGRMARVIARLPIVPTPARIASAAAQAGLDESWLQVLDSPDESFVGGWSGLTARTLVVPARWAQLPEPALAGMLLRRRIAGTSGAHTRGIAAIKAVEDSCLRVRTDAGAMINHGHHVRACCFAHHDLNRASRRGILDGIVEKVE